LALQDALNPESQILPPRLDLKGHASEFAAPESCGVQNACWLFTEAIDFHDSDDSRPICSNTA
jgi:hypothetical protein